MKVLQKQFWMNEPHDKPLPKRPIVVDGFAGGGGASTGLEMALGRHVDIAINHNESAIAMHMANHPDTKHYCEDIWDIDPVEACEGRPVDLAWFSPDCTHFSKARGSKPVKKHIRGLAWVVVKWAELVKPRVIMLENVEEFQTWGPTDPETNKPIKEKAGVTFQLWKVKLQELGYEVEHRVLRACDYGSPTTRKRLFLVARCDGKPIVWPEPSHGSPKQIKEEIKKTGHSRLKKWRTAAEIIDFSIPCPSIFLTPEEAKKAGCRRPLAEKTMNRIAEGIKRYVIENADPFIVSLQHGGSLRGIDQPYRTITASRKDCNCLVTPFLSSAAYTKSTGRGKYIYKPEEPVRTITSTNDKCVIAPTLMSYYGPKNGDNGHRGRSIDDPIPTQTTENRFGLVSAFIAKHYGGVVGVDARTPFPTITQRGTQNQVAAAFLAKMNHGGKQTFSIDEPVRTIVAQGTHHAEVRAFLMKYYGSGTNADPIQKPLSTITSKERLCLGIVLVGGEPYQIMDIGMRMLTPRELFKAQGFPDHYEINIGLNGKPATKSQQVARCGNSVCPQVVKALVHANY